MTAGVVDANGDIKVARKPNKGLSKYRKGFPVKLSKDQVLMLHLTYLWMQKHGETDEHIDAVIATLPAYTEAKQPDGSYQYYRDRQRSKTLRVRGPEVPALIKLLERAYSLPYKCSYSLKRRAEDLKAVGAMDLMVDAQRE